MPNKLAQEKSPYLLQHATNPVEWYPWSDEALNLAKSTGKPIFLSIGYSTCHWCHVMAHESFENKETAELMNRHFINIKVDREERPDVDALYMAAVQALTGGGGWPMSVWLTPDLKPFYGGTYFPREDSHGRPGFKTVLNELARIWSEEKGRAVESAKDITAFLEDVAKKRTGGNGTTAGASDLPKASELYDRAFKELSGNFDPTYGGFGSAPKFPMPVYLDFLLSYHKRTGQQQALDMVAFTMKKINAGGITDQLAGGFARYSTDAQWIVPHFEKMLYDNAQLISIAVSLFDITQDASYKQIAEKALGYVLKTLRDPKGGFYSAEDADSEGKEGTFYIWTVKEIKDIVGDKADLYIARTGISIDGNFFDPHTGETGKNVLTQAQEIDALAHQFKKSAAGIKKDLDDAERLLLAVREKRPRPHLDDKVLTEWNGLMISALAQAGAAFKDKKYVEAAEQAARFIKNEMFESAAGTLFRRWRQGERGIPGQQADYAMLIQGLLDLYLGSNNKEWLDWAGQLQDKQDELFYDSTQGGYYSNVERNDLIFRMKDDIDNVIPSGNSIAVMNELRLSKLTGRTQGVDRARKTFEAFSTLLQQHPTGVCKMLTALDLYTHS